MSYTSTATIISANELGSRVTELLQRVGVRKERVAIASSDGKAQVVVISLSELEQLEKLKQEAGRKFRAILEEGWRNVEASGATDEELDQAISQAIEEVRAGRD